MIYHDPKQFAIFSYLAKLMAAEDIIVRWNVPFMTSAAAMDPAGRILDVSPILQEHADKIPGLITHEIAHFVFSDDISHDGPDNVRSVDEEKSRALYQESKSRHIANIIEDGYVERCAVAKWPGTLEGLRTLYDYDLVEWKKSKTDSNLFMNIINTLHINVLGIKWGEKYPYDKAVPKPLLTLLEKARVIIGTGADRVALSNQIFDAMQAMTPKTKVMAKRKVIPIPAPVDEPSEEEPPEAISPKALNKMLEDKQKVDLVDSMATVRNTPLPEITDNDGTLPEIMNAEDVDEPVAGNVKLKTEAKEKEDVDDDEEDDEVGSLQEFISDNAANILGSNSFYMKHLVQHTSPADHLTTRYVASYQDMIKMSEVIDIIDPQVKKVIDTMSFNKFQGLMRAGDSYNAKSAKKLFTWFFKKVEIAKGVSQSMFQQFDTKANAMNLANLKRRTTGSLDPTRASMFAIYDDIFKKRTMAPRQINHAYVIMVDWSASMALTAMELFHRVIELVMFARLAQIELEVWLFTTADRAMSDKAIEEAVEIRDFTLITGSKFIKVTNTKSDNADLMMYKLFTLYCAAMSDKNRDLPYDATLPFTTKHNFYFCDTAIRLGMSGTNSFEAMQFATHRISQMNADKKAIMLLSDGDDGPWAKIVNRRKAPAAKWSKIFMGRTELNAYANTMMAQFMGTMDKYTFQSLRSTATFMLAEETRKSGVTVIGVTWGSFVNTALKTITRGNTLRVDVPISERINTLTTYNLVKNNFITSITEALLSNIRK